jgi:oligo-1,6-glucosidase
MWKVRSLTTVATVTIAVSFGLILTERHFLNLDVYIFHQKTISLELDKSEHERKWWKEAVVYEIYPSSFLDSNSDGTGDIPGIISKLGYLHDLGIDIIHLCPHYQSPQVDMGYDISDYNSIHAPYGTLDDVQNLINATHALGMKIIFDLVINHSSDQHKWFLESRSSKTNPKRDWYFWRPTKIDEQGKRHPPNNWRSHFTVPAWTWDEVTQEYYMHVYAPEMPDFNWENPETRQAIYDSAIIFWLEKGIDGFRIDTVNKYSKDVSFPDAEITDPGEESQPASMYYNNGPRIHEFLGEMKGIFERYGAVTVGELSHLPRSEERVMEFVSESRGQLNMVFNYDLMALGQKEEIGKSGRGPLNVAAFKNEMSRWQKFATDTDGWITLVLENHDSPRSISRFGSDSSFKEQVRSGKMLAILMVSLTGTLFLYQGQELGMRNAPRSWPAEEFKEARSVNRFKKAKERCKDDSACMKAELDKFWETARDHARLPMPWDDGPNAGFTSEGATPWMRLNNDWKKKNAKMQSEDPDSLLEFWKRLLKLRKEYKDIFVYGRYELVETKEDEVFAFTKVSQETKSLTVLNMSGEPKNWEELSSFIGLDCKLLIGNIADAEYGGLRPWEGRVYICNT